MEQLGALSFFAGRHGPQWWLLGVMLAVIIIPRTAMMLWAVWRDSRRESR
ncbi:MAG: hypothetical protein OWR62_09790 [Sulfobacillus thermotolerans]|nr:hypothetical protein [Sulfobacillus thermotolerans]